MASIKISKIKGKNEFSIHGLTLGKIMAIQNGLGRNDYSVLSIETYSAIYDNSKDIGALKDDYNVFA